MMESSYENERSTTWTYVFTCDQDCVSIRFLNRTSRFSEFKCCQIDHACKGDSPENLETSPLAGQSIHIKSARTLFEKWAECLELA